MNINTINLLLNIKNNSAIKKNGFYFTGSKQAFFVLELLYTQGFIQSFNFLKLSGQVYVFLRYFDNKPVFQYLKLLSKISKSQNLTFLELSKFFNKRFVLFLSTNKGLFSSYDCKRLHIGGKCLFFC